MVDRFEKILLRKEATTKRILDKAEANLNQYKDNLNFFESVGIQKLLKKKEVSLLYYIHDTLNAWSDKNMAIPDVFSHSKLKHPIVFLGNAWYKTVNRDVGSENHLIGLILIKWHYSYQNRYLKNGFQKEFHLPPCIMISSNPVMGGHVIHDQKGGFLLSLNVDENANCSMSDISVSLVLFMLAVFAFLYTLRILVRLNRAKRRINWIITGVAVFLILLNYIMFHFRIPGFLFELDLFSPYNFAISENCSSLGHLFLISSFIFFIAYVYFKDFRTEILLKTENKIRYFIRSFSGFLIGVFFFSFIVFLFKKLILDSDISFEPYKILKINYLSFIGFLSIVLLFISFGLFLYKFVNTGKASKFPRRFIFSWFFSFLLFPLFYFLFGKQIDIFGVLFYLILSILI